MLVIHDDGDVLDLLTRLFESRGFEVVTAVTAFRAQAQLESERAIHVVIAPWDDAHAVGGDVYRWTLQHRFDLRAQFVFLATEVTGDFDELVAGRCLAVPASRPAEVVRVAVAAVARRSAINQTPDPITDHGSRPSLLIAEDDPTLLHVMARLLEAEGFRVIQVDSGHRAIDQLHDSAFDVIVADWQMDSGSGADVYAWIKKTKPWLADRVVFLSGGERDDAQTSVLGRPMVRKGQDSEKLMKVLRGSSARRAPRPAACRSCRR